MTNVRPTVCRFAFAAVVLAAIALVTERGEAHKPITSKYTYNDDVFPIFNAQCARCHVEHGVAPMSLMTYKDAFPWAESIRAELVAGHMPPWNAEEGFGALKNARTISAKELDVILTWATGGNPQGDLNQMLPPVTLKNDWVMGPPDVVLKLPNEFTVPADKMEATEEFTIATGTTEPRWIRAVDLLPGTPSIVRSAVVSLKGTESAAAADATPDRILALWVPAHDAEPLDDRVAFRLPAGAELRVRVHYKKTWQFEGKELSDRSAVGIYFASDKAAQELLSVPLTSPVPAGSNQTLTFAHTIGQDVHALGIRPDELPPNITVQVNAVLPDGSHVPMIRLNTRPDWLRRYWFERPVSLPRGSRVEVAANFENPDLLSEAFSAIVPAKGAPAPRAPLRLAIDVVPAHAKLTAP
jgi:hypothetical protein